MLALAFLVAANDPQIASSPPIDEALAHLARAANEVRDVKCTFFRRDYVDGAMKPLEVIELKWRKPGDLAMKWTAAGAEKDRELVLKAGAPTMKIKIAFGLWIDLDPEGSIARGGERHTVKSASPVLVARTILDDAARAVKYGGAVTTMLPKRDIAGASSTCWTTEQPKAAHPDFYAERAEVCVDDATGLTSIIKVWNREGGALRLVEDYAYSSIKLNPGLVDADFAH